MSVLGGLHSLFGLAALAFGTAVMLRRKGTSSHRRLGWAYVASMAGLLSTSFFIYHLFGGFGPFHALAVVGAVTLLGGVLPAWRRRPPEGWLARHYHFMAYSYAGLVAATAAEIAVRLPDARLGPGAFWGSAAVFAVAAPLIHLKARRTIARFAGGARPPGVATSSLTSR
jgi:uncharacterized membrane protein